MRVKDWMASPVHSVGAGTPLSECAERMRSKNIRHLPVVDDDGKCVSLLTDFEFELRGLFLSGMWVPHSPSDNWLLAGEVGREPEVRADVGTELSVALWNLSRAYQDCLIVTDADGRAVGILTEHDVVDRARTLLPENASSDAVSRKDLPLLDADLSATEARSWMARHRLRHALVVDDGVLKGVLSYRDVALEEAIDDVDLMEVASHPVYRHEPLSAREAAEILYTYKIGCLPIVDAERRPTAVITRREIIDAVIALLGPPPS